MPEPPGIERWTRMRPFRVERLCGQVDCSGVMVWNGQPIGNTPNGYKHQCDACGRVESFDRKYPRIEHKPAGNQPDA